MSTLFRPRGNRAGTCTLFAILAMSWPLVGCAPEDDDPAGPSDETMVMTDPVVELDEAALVEKAMRYQTDEFVQVSAMYPSYAVPGNQVRVFVSRESAEMYGRVTPDETGSGAQLSEGTIIVREVLDIDGRLEKLTMLAQGPEGYNDAAGDLWFAATDVEGEFLSADQGPLHGPLASCSGCHISRAQDGFLFGVADTHRSIEALEEDVEE